MPAQHGAKPVQPEVVIVGQVSQHVVRRPDIVAVKTFGIRYILTVGVYHLRVVIQRIHRDGVVAVIEVVFFPVFEKYPHVFDEGFVPFGQASFIDVVLQKIVPILVSHVPSYHRQGLAAYAVLAFFLIFPRKRLVVYVLICSSPASSSMLASESSSLPYCSLSSDFNSCLKYVFCMIIFIRVKKIKENVS